METGLRLEHDIRRRAKRKSLRCPACGVSHLYERWQSKCSDQLRRAKVTLLRRGSPEEQAEAFKTFLAYAGTYRLDGDKVTHHVEVSSIQNYVDKDLVRSVKFKDDQIILLTPPMRMNGKMQTIELIWQRLAAAPDKRSWSQGISFAAWLVASSALKPNLRLYRLSL